MATTFDSFRLPPQFPEFIPYTGSPKAKPTPNRARKEAESTTDEWIDIDQLLGDVPEYLKAPSAGGAATSRPHPCEGSSPQHPMTIGDAPAYKENNEEVEEGAADPESRSVQADLQFDNPLSVAGQTYRTDGGDISLDLAQHRASLDDNGFMNQDNVFRLERSPVGDFNVPSQPLETQKKRRRSSFAGTDTWTICQTPEPISEQNEAGAHSATRRKLPSPLSNDCVSDHASTPKLASPSCNVSKPQIPHTRDGSFARDGGNDAGVCIATTNSKHCLSDAESDAVDHNPRQHDAPNNERLEPASQPTLFSAQSPIHRDGSEGLHVTDTLQKQGNDRNREAGDGEMGGDNGTEVVYYSGGGGAAAVAAGMSNRRQGSVDSPLPEESTADGGLHRADFEDRNDSESERHRAKWDRRHRQRKPSSSATGNAAHSITQPRSLFTRRKSRQESAPERSRKRVKFTASRPKGGSLSPIPLKRPAIAETRSLPGRRESDNRPWTQTAQKLTQMTLRELPSGESFLAAVVQDDRNVASFAYDQSMTLIDRTLGDARQVDSIAITPLTLNSWLLTGYLHPHLDAVGTDLDQIGTTQASGVSSDSETDTDVESESGTRKLRSKTLDTRVIPLIHNERSSEDSDGSTDNDNELDHNRSYSSDEDETDCPEPAGSRRRRPWERLEEDRLRECIERNEPWKKIGRQLNRSASAARQHWRLMREEDERKDRLPKGRKSRKA